MSLWAESMLRLFSEETQDGLRRWVNAVYGDESILHPENDVPPECEERWAWIAFMLRASPDNPAWFPKGKWATIQHLEETLATLAEREFKELVKSKPTPP